LFAATLIFAVNALTAETSAHAVGGREDPSGGGNTPGDSDSTGRGPSGGGGGVAYDHDSTYAITSAWTNRTDPDRAKYPSPMGYYNGAPGTPTWRPLKDQNRSVGTETKNQWEAKNFPCRTNVSNTDTANGVTYSVLSLGVSWDQNVEWKTIKNSDPLRMEIKRVWINGVECLGKTKIGGKWRYCPTDAPDATVSGPWGKSLPGEKRTIYAVDAAKRPAVNTPGFPKWDTSGDAGDFRRSWNNGSFKTFDNDKKILKAESCGGVEFNNKIGDTELSVNNVGFYTLNQPIFGQQCTWYKLGKSTLNNVTQKHGISGSKNVHTEVWNKDTKWTGCEAKQRAPLVESDVVYCRANLNKATSDDYPFVLRVFENVDPSWAGNLWSNGCGESVKFGCEVNNDPTIMVTGKSQGWTANLNKRNTTLMADGKQAAITWPAPVIYQTNRKDKHLNKVRNRTVGFEQGKYGTKYAF